MDSGLKLSLPCAEDLEGIYFYVLERFGQRSMRAFESRLVSELSRITASPIDLVGRSLNDLWRGVRVYEMRHRFILYGQTETVFVRLVYITFEGNVTLVRAILT